MNSEIWLALLGVVGVVVPVYLTSRRGIDHELAQLQEQAKMLDLIPKHMSNERRAMEETFRTSIFFYVRNQRVGLGLFVRTFPLVVWNLLLAVIALNVLENKDLLAVKTWDPVIEGAAWTILALSTAFLAVVALALLVFLLVYPLAFLARFATLRRIVRPLLERHRERLDSFSERAEKMRAYRHRIPPLERPTVRRRPGEPLPSDAPE